MLHLNDGWYQSNSRGALVNWVWYNHPLSFLDYVIEFAAEERDVLFCILVCPSCQRVHPMSLCLYIFSECNRVATVFVLEEEAALRMVHLF